MSLVPPKYRNVTAKQSYSGYSRQTTTIRCQGTMNSLRMFLTLEGSCQKNLVVLFLTLDIKHGQPNI